MGISDELVRTQLQAAMFIQFHQGLSPGHDPVGARCADCTQAVDAALAVVSPLLEAVEAACRQVDLTPGAPRQALYDLRMTYERLGFGTIT